MGSDDDGVWYELRPNGLHSIGSGNPRRYRSQADAEQAAGEMRKRFPDFRFVEIISYENDRGKRSASTAVSRV